jgi:predicted transcriptional regulator
MPDDESILARRRTARSKHTAQALAKLSASLADVDWRLLHWLLRYPLQRVDDLVVGVARWASRATVYRHVQALEASGLVESVLPKTPGAGKRLYHLSNAGLHVLAGHRQRPTRELVRGFQADEAGLLRVLARLPTLLVLQDVVNGLITRSAEAVTSGGRRPQLVRWDWQRDVAHRFQYREQVTRLFVDGAVALCIRAPQVDGSVLDQWYGLFILSTELDDERLMRLRMERLLCWRESPERWSTYQHMPPMLILAKSPRQCDLWQRAVEAAALKLRLEPLVGAVACLSSAENAHLNPWLLTWRTLSTDLPCHLRDLLRPLPRIALPPSLRMEEGEVVGESDARAPSSSVPMAGNSGATPTRLARLIVGDLAHRVACIARAAPEEREVIALLGLRLTPCQWRILRLLLAHPLLSAEELAAFLRLRRSSARCSLYELHGLGCLEPIATTAGGKRWHLCGRGLRLLASAEHIHIRNMATWPENTEVPETANVIQ